MFWIILIVAIIIMIALAVHPQSNEHLDIVSEYNKYTDDLYETFYLDSMLIDVSDGEYDATIFSSHKKGYDYPIEVRIHNSSSVVGYLFEDRNLYNIIKSGDGYIFAPLFIKTTSDKKRERFAYIYIDKKLLKIKRQREVKIHDSFYIEDAEDITNEDLEDILFDLSDYSYGDDYIELPIRGINYRNLTDVNIGYIDGYIMPDKENKNDRYAIGVYDNNDTHFGFIEKGQKKLYDKIEEVGGFINVKLDVETFIDGTGKNCFQGTITINKEDLI